MGRSRRLVFALVAGLAAVAVIAPPVSAAGRRAVAPSRAITVTPHDNLLSGQTVTVAGSGFTPNVSIGTAQCAGDMATDQIECSQTVTRSTDGTGGFSFPFVVSRLVGTITCGGPTVTCLIVVAELSNPGTTLQTVNLTFAPSPYRPDAQIRRRSDGVLLGDNIYNLDGA